MKYLPSLFTMIFSFSVAVYGCADFAPSSIYPLNYFPHSLYISDENNLEYDLG